jgi:ABC-type microcin C transport system permease subunit YejB
MIRFLVVLDTDSFRAGTSLFELVCLPGTLVGEMMSLHKMGKKLSWFTHILLPLKAIVFSGLLIG